MLASQVHRHFARRMLPVALVVGAVVAAAPPAAYRIAAWRQLQAQAAIYAVQMAAGMQRAVELDPYLWRYNSAKAVAAVAVHQGQHDIGGVTVTDCAGRQLFAPSVLGVGSGAGGGPSASASILRGNRIAGRVLVSMDPSDAALGAARGRPRVRGRGRPARPAPYLFPTRVVRRQAGELAGGPAPAGAGGSESSGSSTASSPIGWPGRWPR